MIKLIKNQSQDFFIAGTSEIQITTWNKVVLSY